MLVLPVAVTRPLVPKVAHEGGCHCDDGGRLGGRLGWSTSDTWEECTDASSDGQGGVIPKPLGYVA